MTITISPKKMIEFVKRHKEAVVVGVIALVVIRHQHETIVSMEGYINHHELKK